MKATTKAGFPGEESFVVKKNKGKGAKHSNFLATQVIESDDTPGQVFVKFPNFIQMTCEQLNTQIINMKEYLNTPTFAPMDPEVVAAYQNAIKTATALYESKGCLVKGNGYGEVNQVENGQVKNVTATDPVTNKTTVIGTVKSELGGVAADVSKTVKDALKSDTAKKTFPWLVVIGVAGIAYLLFRK